MKDDYVVRYDPVALTALDEAARFIEEQSGCDRAIRWLRAMHDGVQQLEVLPRAFGVWTVRGGRPIHAKLVSPYRVFYVVDEPSSTVYVIDVVHTARETRIAPYRDAPD